MSRVERFSAGRWWRLLLVPGMAAAAPAAPDPALLEFLATWGEAGPWLETQIDREAGSRKEAAQAGEGAANPHTEEDEDEAAR